MSHLHAALLTLLAAAAVPARAEGPVVSGTYATPLGRVAVKGDGTTFTGRLLEPAGPCAFAAGDEVLKGTLLDDSLAGQVKVCLSGAGCQAEAWVRVVLLVGPGGLSGAAHVQKGCTAPLGKAGGLTFTRQRAAGAARPKAKPAKAKVEKPASAAATGGALAPAPAAAEPASAPPPDEARPRPTSAARARARELLRDGAAWLQEGNFERARKRFLEAIDADPQLPEAFNGVGVTYRMRNDLPVALAWYKRALSVDPDFGDAYYNMACVYALQGQDDLALRYLQIAAVNGYVTAEGIDEDPDLAALRDKPAYRALVKARL